MGPSWISNPNYALYTLVALAVWQFGSPMVIFLAGLKQIPQDLYDAAEVDGAGPVRKFFRITLPLLTPIIFFNLVMQMIGAFQAFTPAYIISGGNGGPADATLFYTLYLYEQALHQLPDGLRLGDGLGARRDHRSATAVSFSLDTGSTMATSAKDAGQTIAVAEPWTDRAGIQLAQRRRACSACSSARW